MKLITVLMAGLAASAIGGAAGAATITGGTPLPGATAYSLAENDFYFAGERAGEDNKTSTDLSVSLSAKVLGYDADTVVTTSVVTNAATGSIKAMGSSSDGDGDYVTGSSGGNLSYYFRADGATGFVPIDITYKMYVSSTNGGDSVASILIVDASENTLYQNLIQSAHNTPNPDATLTAGGTFSFSTMGGTANLVQLMAGADGYGLPGQGVTTYSAYIDPYIAIDPTYLAAHPGVTLEVSAGVDNAPPSGVPEPSTWTFALAGLFALGGALRVSRRSTAAITA
jgi:hypothetical protein